MSEKSQNPKLGTFHTELLEHLLRSSEKQIEEAGIDVESDPQARELLKSLSPTSADEMIPLSEIIENYQHLFTAKGPVHIERSLMEAFPVEDFVELGLTRYYPRVYRGLPRLYFRETPSQSRIKKDFTHLPSLKKQALSKSLASLYAKVPTSGVVTIFTYVMSDGLGDFVAAAEVMRLLKGRLSDLDLHFVGLIQEKSVHNLCFLKNSIVIPYDKDPSISLITEEAFKVLRESDLILQMPTYFPDTQGLISHLEKMESAKPCPKFENVGEYGFVESSWFHPKSGNSSMGLHFLEKGILTRRPVLASWEDVQNENLKKWRIPENRFYLAYLSTPIGGAIYLHALLKSLENDPLNIDICVPDIGWFLAFYEKQRLAGKSLIEWEMGIATLELHHENQTIKVDIAGQGKKVRLLCPGTISQGDFRALLALSGEWVAIRGNQSFSEAVSQGKAFFYDGRGHARFFLKDLSALAENRLGSYPGALECIRGMVQGFFYQLPVEDAEWVEESYFQELEDWTAIALKMGLALQDPEAAEGFKKLSRIIVEECSANSYLCNLVQRGLCHRQHPYIEQLEADHVSRFVKKEISFKELIQAQKTIVYRTWFKNWEFGKASATHLKQRSGAEAAQLE